MNVSSASLCDKFLNIISDEAGNSKGVRMIGYIGERLWQRKLPVLYEDIDQQQAEMTPSVPQVNKADVAAPDAVGAVGLNCRFSKFGNGGLLSCLPGSDV